MNNGKRTMWVWQRLCRCLKPRRQWVRLGSPTSGPCTGTSRSPVRKLATQQEVIGSKVHLLLPIAPHELYCHLNHCFHYCLNHPLPLLHRKNCLPGNRSLVPKVGDSWVRSTGHSLEYRFLGSAPGDSDSVIKVASGNLFLICLNYRR